MSSTIKYYCLFTFLIDSSPAPENGAAISSGPPREPGGGKSSPPRTKSPRPCLNDINPA